MGMCKGCNQVFNANDMVGSYCQDCATDEIREKVNAEKMNLQNNINESINLEFKWWKTWAWLNLTLGNAYLFNLGYTSDMSFSILLIALYSILFIFVLRYNKWCFLVATILCLNPLLWIINGIYLKNRWKHPLVN